MTPMTPMTPATPPPTDLRSSAERFAAWEARQARRVLVAASARWIVFALLVIATLFLAFHRPAPNVIPKREQSSLDSLFTTKPFYEAQRHALVVHETTYVAVARRNAATALVAERAADSLNDVATAWQQAAVAQLDTSSRWYNVAVARSIENDSLRSAIRSLDASLFAQRLATASADSTILLVEARALALENVNARLAYNVRTAGQCRIAWVVSCPSRKVVAVATAAATIALSRADVRNELRASLARLIK